MFRLRVFALLISFGPLAGRSLGHSSSKVQRPARRCVRIRYWKASASRRSIHRAIQMQGALGYTQYFTGVPAALVIIHVIGACHHPV